MLGLLTISARALKKSGLYAHLQTCLPVSLDRTWHLYLPHVLYI
jgi:hypothetical protein